MIRKRTAAQIAALLLLVLSGCKESQKQYLTFQPEASYPQREIDVSAYLQDSASLVLRSDSVAFNSTERIYPAPPYLLVAQTDKIFLFDTSGKFVKILANTGRGPGEVSFVQDVKTDASGKTLYCLENTTNTIKVFDLTQMKHLQDIPLAKPGVSSFDFTDDSSLICFTVLNAYFNNPVFAYTQDFQGNVIKEIPFNTDRFEGPVYSGPPVLHKTGKGYLYMQYPADTVYFVEKGLSFKPIVAVELSKRENEPVNYKILFATDERFVLSVTRHTLENQGDRAVLMIPGTKKYFEFDLMKREIFELTNTDLDQLTFNKTGYCVQMPRETELHSCKVVISKIK